MTPKKDIPLMVSACLAGVNCTYKSKNNTKPFIRDLYLSGRCLLVCPEVMGGLSVPRESAEIICGDGLDVICKRARIVSASGKDVTRECLLGTSMALRLATKHKVKKAILKSMSPCCGKGMIYDGTFKKAIKRGDGVLASALIGHGIRVFTEKDLKICLSEW